MQDDESLGPVQGALFETLPNPHAIGSKAWSRYDEMRAEAIAFHKAHPEVWQLLRRYVLKWRALGFKRCSIGMVWELIRWETNQAVVNQDEEFKVNNNHRAFYSRAFMAKYPELEGFFRKREQKSKHEHATGLPPLGPRDFQ